MIVSWSKVLTVEMVRSNHILYYSLKVKSPGSVVKLKDLEESKKSLRRNSEEGGNLKNQLSYQPNEESDSKRREWLIVSKAIVRWKSKNDHWIYWSLN